MTIEIVDLPIENGGSFHSYVNVYERVNDGKQRIGSQKNLPDLDSNVAIHHVDPLGDLQQKHLGDSKMEFQVVFKGPIYNSKDRLVTA